MGMTAVRQVAYDDGVGPDQGERQAIELADRLRALAAADPNLAQHLVEDLIARLNQATDGAFTEHVDQAERDLVSAAKTPAGAESPQLNG
jgi:hypothetical protein